MMGTMKQRLATLIWAAILVVAIQFVPSLALAHSGHDHHAGTATASVPGGHHHGHGAAGHADMNAVHAQIGVAHHDIGVKAAEPAQVIVAASDADEGDGSPPASCIGGCCGISFGCCGAVLAGAPPDLPDSGGGDDVVAALYARPSGIDPDALIRPPKPLA